MRVATFNINNINNWLDHDISFPAWDYSQSSYRFKFSLGPSADGLHREMMVSIL